jgi:hypothetical protein
MNNRLMLAALAAAVSLSACNQNKEPEVIGGPADPMANEVANAAPPPPLPVIAAEKKYRCDGNKVVDIDWLEMNGQPAGATVQSGEGASVQTVAITNADPAGGFVSAEGGKLTGTKDAASITLTLPGGQALTCKG